jgi:hypothetical protein
LLATKFDASHVLGLVSIDFHLGSPFFSYRTRTLLLFVYLLLPTPLALSLQKATPVLTTTLTPLSLLGKSLTRFVCSDVPISLSRSPSLAAHTLRITLNFSPQKAGTAVGRPAACATTKGASGRRPRCPPCCRRGCDAASDPPPRGRTHLIESQCQGGN